MILYKAIVACSICGKTIQSPLMSDPNDAEMILRQEHYRESGHWVLDPISWVETGSDKAPRHVPHKRKS